MLRTFRLKASLLLVAATVVPLLTAQDVMVTVRTRAADDGISERRLRAIGRLASASHRRLLKWFPDTALRPITLVIHSDSSSLSAGQRQGLQSGVPGFARLQHDEIHLVMAEIRIDPPNDLRTTIDHELVHILLDQHVGANGLHVPRWFHEGLAQVLAGGLYLDIQEERLATLVKSRRYLPFKSLRQSFPVDDPDALALAYGQSYSFVAYLRQEVGLAPLLAAARACSAEAPFYRVLSKQLGKGLTLYELEWCEFIADSGAGFRVIMRNCFMLLILVVVGPLLALAVARRRNREVVMKQRMAAQEREDERLQAMLDQADELIEPAEVLGITDCDDEGADIDLERDV